MARHNARSPSLHGVLHSPPQCLSVSFTEDLERYFARLAFDEPVDLLDETAPARSLKRSSIKTKRYQVRQFASALVLTGVPIAEISSLAKLVTPAHFKQGLRFFLERPRRDKANTRTAGQIAHTIRSIAKYFLKLPEADLVAFDTITARLNRRTPGMTEQNRRKLAQFDDEMVLRQFLSLPLTEIGKLRDAGVKTRHDAVAFSVLVGLEIIIHAPMRISNVAALSIDEHIRFPRDPDGETVILLPRNIVKNVEPLQYLVPKEVTALLREYIDLIKPKLEVEASPFLFRRGDTGKCGKGKGD